MPGIFLPFDSFIILHAQTFLIFFRTVILVLRNDPYTDAAL